jgi:Haem-binding domain
MKIPRCFKRTLMAVGGLALVIQFIPVSRKNPPVIPVLPWDSPGRLAVAKRACLDCHSNETQWPWYSYVAPISWMIASDVKEARERFNFSEISPEDSVGSLVKRINNGTMPPPKYLTFHPEARLSEADKRDYIAGLRRSFGLSGVAPDEALARQQR